MFAVRAGSLEGGGRQRSDVPPTPSCRGELLDAASPSEDEPPSQGMGGTARGPPSAGSWRKRAKDLQAEVYALALAYRDPRVPFRAKALAAAAVAYALSPIDLIPDFIPVLGQLDDLVVLSALTSLALRMIPQEVMKEYKAKARSEIGSNRGRWVAAALVILFWSGLLFLLLMTIRARP